MVLLSSILAVKEDAPAIGKSCHLLMQGEIKTVKVAENKKPGPSGPGFSVQVFFAFRVNALRKSAGFKPG